MQETQALLVIKMATTVPSATTTDDLCEVLYFLDVLADSHSFIQKHQYALFFFLFVADLR